MVDKKPDCVNPPCVRGSVLMGGQVTLVDAAIQVAEDGEVWGYILVEDNNAQRKLYAQFLPQHVAQDPPGWRALEELTGVSAEDVRTSWAEDQIRNPAAERAFSRLRERIGQKFFAREVQGIAGMKAVELVAPLAIDPTIADGLDASAPAHAVVLRAHFNQVVLGDRVLEVHADGTKPARLRLPCPELPDPPEWFFVEATLGVSAARVVTSWVPHPSGTLVNPLVPTIVSGLDAGFRQLETLPVDEQHAVDLDRLRSEVVRRWYAEGVKPVVFLGRDPQVTAHQCWSLLRDLLGPHLLRYNAERGKSVGIPAVVRIVDGKHNIEVLDSFERMRGVLITFIRFTAQVIPKTAPGKLPIYIDPPRALCEHLVLFPDQSCPPVEALVRIPTARADGTVLDVEGYDARTRTWYAPEVTLSPIPDAPDGADVRKALATILTPFSEFPYVEHSGARAAVVACLLDQVVRPLIKGPRPLFAFDAPAVVGQGSGKSLLAQAIAAVVTGHAEITSFPDDPRELPKLITAKLMAQDLFVIFDNLEGQVKHKDLAAVATASVWSSRLLGKLENIRIPQTATWCLTLNGAEFSRDIARRTVVIRLDARAAHAYLRKGFKIRDLVPWCIQHRAELIHACLVLVRAWDRAHRPTDPDLVVGSFESWAAVVGGILYHAGLPGLAAAIRDARGRDSSSEEHEDFVIRWRMQFGDAPVNALALSMMAVEHGLYATKLERARTPNWQARYMAEQLQRLLDQEIGGHVIERSAQRHNGMWLYRLRAARGTAV